VDAAAVMPRGEGCVVVLDRPGNPGNLGSILRSCDAFDALGIVMTGHAVDPFDPVVIRASAGAFFSRRIVPIADHESFAAWLAACRAACPGLAVLGTSEKAALLLPRADLTGPRVLAFGNEATGLSPWLTSLCGGMVGMPMRGVASSLNLACAVTAVLYERDRQRRNNAAASQ